MSKLKRFDICIGGDFPDKDDHLTCDDGEFADGEVTQELYDALQYLVDLIFHPSIDADETLPELVAAKTALAKARGES